MFNDLTDIITGYAQAEEARIVGQEDAAFAAQGITLTLTEADATTLAKALAGPTSSEEEEAIWDRVTDQLADQWEANFGKQEGSRVWSVEFSPEDRLRVCHALSFTAEASFESCHEWGDIFASEDPGFASGFVAEYGELGRNATDLLSRFSEGLGE